jgi:predicted nucleotidyltransferase
MSETVSLQDKIREVVVPALEPYASRIELFGSLARGEDGDGSDVELLVWLRPAEERPPLGLRWFELEQELSSQLGRSVDLVTDRALSRHVRPYVDPDRVVVWREG